MKHICPHCKIECDIKAGYINRAKKLGVPKYCSKKCSGLARRNDKTTEQKKAEKAAYDKIYHKTDKRKESHKRYNETPAGRATQKRAREKLKEYHLEYCRTPEYRAWKKDYDQLHVAKKHFGAFAEASLILEQISGLVDNREAVQLKGTINKSQKRKRAWLKTKKSNLPQLP